MKTNQRQIQKAVAIAACFAVGAVTAQAQSLFTTQGNVIASTGDAVPGAGVGDLFGGTAGFNAGLLDESGGVFFQAQFQGGSVLPTTDRALFYGSTKANLAMVIRSGDPAPGLPGVTLNTATGNGIGSSPRIASNGKMFFCAALTGTGVTAAVNDSAMITGTPGNFVITARRGDGAVGMTATLNSAINNVSHQGTGINNAGRILFQSATVGGDTVTTGAINSSGWFGGTPGNLELMLRRGDVTPGGQVISALGFISQQNASGVFATEVTLSTTLGTPATAADDRAIYFYTPGGTPGTGTKTLVLREGDSAPGTSGGTFNVASNSWFFNVGSSAMNNSGQLLTWLNVAGGDTIGTTNDAAGYLLSVANPPVMVLRKGDAAPGTDAVFSGVSTANFMQSNTGIIAFQGILTGGTSTTANDTGIWVGTPGNFQLVIREGDAAPGTVGAIVGNLSGLGNFWVNDAGQVTFNSDLSGGDAIPGTNGQGFYGWDPNTGLTLLLRQGDQIEVQPSVFKSVGSWGGIQFSNGDGRSLTLNQSGVAAVRANFTGGASIITIKIPSLAGTAYCFGDGTGTACPCANNGAAGNGCANSLNANGGHLQGNGSVSVANDTLVLSGSGVPNGPGLYFQGTTQLGGGSGITFGDGLRCAGGSVLRLGIVIASGNASQIPTGGPSISTLGFCASGDVRHYQLWYRDSDPVFCSPSVFNLTNALTITWAP